VIPLKDDNPLRSTPLVTIALVLVNVVVFLYEFQLMLTDPNALNAFMDAYSFDYGALTERIAASGITLGGVVPLFTHMFLHANWLHVGGNMLYLWIFGNNVEDRLGAVRFLLFYLAAGLAAALGQGMLAPGPMVGASGAIAGVLAAYLLMFPGARVSTLIFLGLFITIIQLPALLVIGFWIVEQLVAGLGALRMSGHAAGGVAYFAHIIGFAAGIPLLFLLRPSARRVY
jgi:membrane associated rhomboid family serine protease